MTIFVGNHGNFPEIPCISYIGQHQCKWKNAICIKLKYPPTFPDITYFEIYFCNHMNILQTRIWTIIMNWKCDRRDETVADKDKVQSQVRHVARHFCCQPSEASPVGRLLLIVVAAIYEALGLRNLGGTTCKRPCSEKAAGPLGHHDSIKSQWMGKRSNKIILFGFIGQSFNLQHAFGLIKFWNYFCR